MPFIYWTHKSLATCSLECESDLNLFLFSERNPSSASSELSSHVVDVGLKFLDLTDNGLVDCHCADLLSATAASKFADLMRK